MAWPAGPPPDGAKWVAKGREGNAHCPVSRDVNHPAPKVRSVFCEVDGWLWWPRPVCTGIEHGRERRWRWRPRRQEEDERQEARLVHHPAIIVTGRWCGG